MKTTLYIFLMIVIALLSGCSDDDNVSVLEITGSSVEIPASGGSGEINFIASGKVTPASNKSWLSIAFSEVTTTSIPFVVEPNESMSSRIAEITVTDGRIVQKVHVVQTGGLFMMDVEDIVLSPFSEETCLDFTSTIEPKLEVTGSWLEATYREGQLVLLPQTNTSGMRSAEVTLKTPWKSASFTVTQRALSLDKNQLLLHRNGKMSEGVISFTEYSDAFEGVWQVASNENWFTATPMGGSIVIRADENTTGAVRTGFVDVLINGNLLETITVNQEIFSYESFLGTWKVDYHTNSTMTAPATLTMTLSERSYGSSYNAKGLVFSSNQQFVPDVKIEFDPKTGNLTILYQILGAYGSNNVHLFLWDIAAGMVVRDITGGFLLEYNHNAASPGFTFVSNNPSYNYNGLYATAVDSSGNLLGYVHRIYYPSAVYK